MKRPAVIVIAVIVTACGSGRPDHLEAGGPDARFRFPIPAGFRQTLGMAQPTDATKEEMKAAGPVGIGLAATNGIVLNSIAVFTDPLGLGRDMTGSMPTEQELATIAGFMREKFPSATTPVVVTIGPWQAIRIDMPEAIMPGRPNRSGRSYMIFDGKVTASIDCLWLAEQEAKVRAACDEVAAHMVRVTK